MNVFHQKIDTAPSTADLVRSAQAGDRDAFGLLYERFQPTVLAIAMKRVRDHAAAQELSQDVFMKAMQKIDQLRQPECFIGWLRQITVRMAINRAVRQRHAVAVEPEILESTVCEYASPLDKALEFERRDQVHAGLEQLGQMDRETLVAFYVNGQSLIQMADEFDAPLGTIKRRLHVARKRLAVEVESMAVA